MGMPDEVQDVFNRDEYEFSFSSTDLSQESDGLVSQPILENYSEDGFIDSNALFFNETYCDYESINQNFVTQPRKKNKNFGTCKSFCTQGLKYLGLLIVIPTSIALGLSFGLLIYTGNELIKAYQADKDYHSKIHRTTIIAPTLIATAAVGYGVYASIALLAGLTISTAGMALIIFAAVSVTAALVVSLTKFLTNRLYEPYQLSSELTDLLGVQREIDRKMIKIKSKGCTFFCSYNNDIVRELRQNIYDLSKDGQSLTVP